jgi:phosphoribosylformimino-5-aminoimidazole carboxamide ribotide isomerase
LILYPAIDIHGGRAVRLAQGDYQRETEFDVDPLDAALRWVDQGARALHVVDLDGARAGRPANLGTVERIAGAVSVPVQLGGGLRDSATVESALATGVERVVIGTAALEDPQLIGALIEAHAGRVLIAVDVREGKVSHSGWAEAGEVEPTDLVAEMGRRGARGFVYTPIEVDGMLGGPAVGGLGKIADMVAAANGELIYSGGVGSLEHLRVLAALQLAELSGVIVGRALYEGRFTVAEGQAALGGR